MGRLILKSFEAASLGSEVLGLFVPFTFHNGWGYVSVCFNGIRPFQLVDDMLQRLPFFP